MERIVVAYSGGLDTSVAIRWLAEQYGAEIIAVTLDIGQGRELADIRERALALGAVRAHVIDAREEFVARLHPAGAAGRRALRGSLSARHRARRGRWSPSGWSRSRGWSARRPSRTAAAARATTRSASTSRRARSTRRSGSSRRRASWDMSPAQVIEYAKARNLPVPPAVESTYSTDANLWGRSIECGVLEDPWAEPPEDIYQLTRAPQDGPDEPAYVEIEFEAGVPVRANGIEMPLLELIESLDTIAGSHGVGRIDMVENRLIGIKSREVYEAPAAVVLHTAHRELEKLVIARDLERIKHDLGAHLRRPRLQRPVVLADARGDRRVRRAPSSRASPARSG